VAGDVDEIADRNHGDRREREDHRHHGRGDEQRLVDVRRRKIFFQQKFDSVRGRLQQAERAYPRWSPAILHVADDLALKPNRVGHRSKQDEERDCGLITDTRIKVGMSNGM